MAIVWDDKLKRNLLDIGSALNPRWGRALSAGVDLFENMFLDTGSGGIQRCSINSSIEIPA
jgi:hypothetical protein